MRYSSAATLFRTSLGLAAGLGIACSLAGCDERQSEALYLRGWDNYGYESAISCGAKPVLLLGNSMELTVSGPCGQVRVAGNHNDISIEVAPGGTIEITGNHNDVTWHLPPGARFTPILLDHGTSNTFHGPG